MHFSEAQTHSGSFFTQDLDMAHIHWLSCHTYLGKWLLSKKSWLFVIGHDFCLLEPTLYEAIYIQNKLWRLLQNHAQNNRCELNGLGSIKLISMILPCVYNFCLLQDARMRVMEDRGRGDLLLY